MVEPPPIVQPPVHKPWTAWKATGAGLILVMAVVVLANILAIPAIVVAVVQQMMPAGKPAYKAVSVVRAPIQPEAAERVRKTLNAKLQRGGVEVALSPGRATFEVPMPPNGRFDTIALDQELKAALTKERVDPDRADKFAQVSPGLSYEKLMADPVTILGSGFALQLAILAAWLIGVRVYFKGSMAFDPFHKGALWRPIVFGAVLGVLVCFGADRLNTFVRSVLHERGPSMWEATAAWPVGAKVGVILMGVIGAPILEELFFRGMLIGLFQKAGKPWHGVAFSSVVFGVLHLQNVATILTITLMGLLLGVVYVKTRSIYATIAIHMVNNAVSFGLLFATATK